MRRGEKTVNLQNPAPVDILVVEDEPSIRRLICGMLEQNQFSVLETGLAHRAIGLLDSHPEIRLAIIDMVMPGMSGLDVAAEMGRRHPGIQILYVSGYVASIAIQAIADRDPDAVLLKPFSEGRLIARVRRLLGMGAGQATDSEPIALTVESAWERLIEGSDELPHPYRIASYRDTSVAYSIAAAHAAVLREAGMQYQFTRHDDDPTLPFELLAPAEQWRAAMACISVLGLSADIALAA